MDMQNMEQSRDSLNRLTSTIAELESVLRQQKQKFQQQLDAEKQNSETALSKVSDLEAQLQTISAEKEKLQADLIVAQDNSESEGKIKALQDEAEARNNKINGLQTEIQNLNTAVANRKTQIDELNSKNDELSSKNDELAQKLEAAQKRIAEFENSAAADNSANAELQNKLDEALKQNEELTRKNQESEHKLEEMQKTITQTTANIDAVVARLEEVLEENGAGNNNN